jgi:hypothetical protein
MGYVKVSLMAFDMSDFNGLQAPGSPFVEPYKLAELHNRGRAVSFVLPGSNVRYKKLRVQDGFRLAIYEQLSDERTKIRSDGCSIKDMLYYLEDGEIEIEKCPCCGVVGSFAFKASEDVNLCPNSDCGAHVYVTDSLRIHEQISDDG